MQLYILEQQGVFAPTPSHATRDGQGMQPA
jgi:hypothetical protein